MKHSIALRIAILTVPVFLTVSYTYATDTVNTADILTIIRQQNTAIKTLAREIRSLRTQILALQTALAKVSGPVTSTANMTSGVAPIPTTSTPPVSTGATTGTSSTTVGATAILQRYKTVIATINAKRDQIMQANSISGTIVMYEFVEPDAVFVDIDDGKTEAGENTFSRKVLYRYDATGENLKVIGIFAYDTATSRYTTLYGANPYAKSDRIRIQNPSYTGKLLAPTVPLTATGIASVLHTSAPDSVVAPIPKPVVVPVTASGATSVSVGSGTGISSVTGTVSIVATGSTSIVTIDAIRIANAKKNNELETIRLCEAYIKAYPNDTEALKTYYRNLFYLKRYKEAFDTIKTIETNQGALDTNTACEASAIGQTAAQEKVAGYEALTTYYKGICMK